MHNLLLNNCLEAHAFKKGPRRDAGFDKDDMDSASKRLLLNAPAKRRRHPAPLERAAHVQMV